jgi:hypothetical protein
MGQYTRFNATPAPCWSAVSRWLAVHLNGPSRQSRCGSRGEAWLNNDLLGAIVANARIMPHATADTMNEVCEELQGAESFVDRDIQEPIIHARAWGNLYTHRNDRRVADHNMQGPESTSAAIQLEREWRRLRVCQCLDYLAGAVGDRELRSLGRFTDAHELGQETKAGFLYEDHVADLPEIKRAKASDARRIGNALERQIPILRDPERRRNIIHSACRHDAKRRMRASLSSAPETRRDIMDSAVATHRHDYPSAVSRYALRHLSGVVARPEHDDVAIQATLSKRCF